MYSVQCTVLSRSASLHMICFSRFAYVLYVLYSIEPHHLSLAYYLLLSKTGQDGTGDRPTAVKQLNEQLCMQYINSYDWSFDYTRIAAYCMIICSSAAIAIAVVAASLPFSLPMKNSPKAPEAVTASVLKRNSGSVFPIYKYLYVGEIEDSFLQIQTPQMPSSQTTWEEHAPPIV